MVMKKGVSVLLLLLLTQTLTICRGLKENLLAMVNDDEIAPHLQSNRAALEEGPLLKLPQMLTAAPRPTESPTSAPIPPTVAPTRAPTDPPTRAPTDPPTRAPTDPPTRAPTDPPTRAPTAPPTRAPTDPPTRAPTAPPTRAPTAPPTRAPTAPPTKAPTDPPTKAPTDSPVTTTVTDPPVTTTPRDSPETTAPTETAIITAPATSSTTVSPTEAPMTSSTEPPTFELATSVLPPETIVDEPVTDEECCPCETTIVAEDATRLKILTAGGAGFAQIEQFVRNNARSYEEYTDGNVKIDVTAAPSLGDLFDEIKADSALSSSQFDGYVTNPQITGSAVQNGGFWDLEKFVKANSLIDWTDILLTYRNTVNVYDKKIYLMPLDGDTHSMFYRKDVLEYFGLQVPRTWQEYTNVAKAVHGKMYNGTELIGSCVGRIIGCVGYFSANSILSSLTQYDGTTTGFLFDSKDMTPLTGVALAEAIRYSEDQVKYGAPDEFERCGGGGAASANIKYMNEGTCVMTYNWGDSFKIHLSEGSKIGGLLGVAKTPGSTHVFDRKTRKLVPCTAELCKFATFYPDLGWVNRAPYAAFGGWSAAVAAKNGAVKKKATADFFAFASSTEESIKGVIPNATSPMEEINGQDPFRRSHFFVEDWVNMGYPKEGVEEYRDTIVSSLDSDNVAIDIRFPEADKINQVYDSNIHDHLLNTKNFLRPESEKVAARMEVANTITNSWNKIISDYDSRPENDATILELYQRSLSIYIPKQNLHQIGDSRIFGLILMSIAFALAIVFCAWTFFHRNVRVVKASQPPFLYMICFGVLTMASAILPASFDDGTASQRGCDIACMASPWLFAIGFTITFSALFSKVWRINKITKNARNFRRLKVTERDVLVPFAVLLALNVICLIAWTFTDPWRFVRIQIDDFNSYGSCRAEGKASKAFFVLIFLVNISALILANVQAYQARNISDEYSESKYIAIAMAAILQMMIIAAPLLFLLKEHPSADFILQAIINFVICSSVLLLIYVPKFIFLRTHRKEEKKKKAQRAARLHGSTASEISSVTSATGFDTDSTMGMRLYGHAEAPKHGNEEIANLRNELDRHEENFKAIVNLAREHGIDVDTIVRDL